MFCESDIESQNTEVYLQDNDICLNCVHTKGRCPFIKGLKENLVLLNGEEVVIKDCGLHLSMEI